MKKVLILEDNRAVLCGLVKLVQEINNNLVAYAYTKAEDAIKCMLEYKIDLFLVDIILNTKIPGDTSGLQFAQKVRMIEQYKFTPLVFITSLEDSKFVTYEELHCYSFIEKPFEPERVKNVVRECLRFPGVISERKLLDFRKDGIVKLIMVDDVIYVESIDHNLHIHMINGNVIKIPYVKLREFVKRTDRAYIMQCRRNTVINIHYVDNIDFSNNVIQFKNGQRVEIGITFKKGIKDILHVDPDDLHN